MSSEFTSCQSLVTEQSPASRPGPVQAERSEPKGSLDGWPRCHILRDEGMAGYLVPASIPKVLASSPRFHSHFFAASIGCVPVGVRKSDGCCNLNADLATTASFGAAPVRTLRAVTRTRRAFPKLNLSSCRYRLTAPADMQRFVYLSADPQLM